MIYLHLRIEVPDESRTEFLDLLRSAIPVYEEPGGIRVRLLEHLEDSTKFIEVVEYDDFDTYSTDQKRVHSDSEAAQYISRWRQLLASPPDIACYRELTSISIGGRL